MRMDDACTAVRRALARGLKNKDMPKAELRQMIELACASAVMDGYLEGYKQAWKDSQNSLERALKSLPI